jgi:type II secretory pathway pseudopilin PulG
MRFTTYHLRSGGTGVAPVVSGVAPETRSNDQWHRHAANIPFTPIRRDACSTWSAPVPGRSNRRSLAGVGNLESSELRSRLRPGRAHSAGFTMIEIALCLAIIGFALVSILLVLPLGMTTQRDTRQETIINQDATVLLEAIRTGARGMDDLTNYVYAITNNFSFYDDKGVFQESHHWGYNYVGASRDNGPDDPAMHLTNGLRIVGLLSTPEFTLGNNLTIDGQALASTFGQFYTSNHVVAYIRSVSGLAAEKPPQNNQIMQEDTFAYRLLCVNAPLSADTNSLWKPSPFYSKYQDQLAKNQRELRLLFSWPQQPNGNVGGYRRNFRATVAGNLVVTNYGYLFPNISPLYFYQPGYFATNAP